MYISLVLLVAAPMLLYWMYWRRMNRRLLELAAMVPGPPALPLIGNTWIFMTNTQEQVKKLACMFDRYGDYVRFWLGPELNIAVKNPADIRLLLTSNKVNQKGPVYNFLLTFIGPGILSGGPTWRNHRKIATPSYNKRSVQIFMDVFNQEAWELTNAICEKASQTYDIYIDVLQGTTSSVCQTLMGLSKEEWRGVKHIEEIMLKTQRIYDLIFKKMTRWWLHVPLIFWLTGGKRQQDEYIKLIDEFSADVVARRRQAILTRKVREGMGIVDRYILSGELTDQEIKWETFTLFTTSQEAAAKIASGVLMFLGMLPDWQKLVYDEIIEKIGDTGTVTEQQLKDLQYLDMVYKETLRYFSIAGLIQRTVEEEIAINDGKIILPVGTSLVVPLHEVHRNPIHWEEPLKVKPERFLPENIMKRDPNAFIPFSLGPMDCLGRVYATALIKTLVVYIVRRVHIESDQPLEDIDLEIAISVKAARGYTVRTRPRHTNGYQKTHGFYNNIY